MNFKVILILILIIAAILRFYQLSDIAQFEYDDQYNSYLVYDLIKNHHLSLVGQEGSFGGIFWGPWHYLYLTPFYMLTNLHPIGGYIGHIVIGLLTIVSYYFVGKKLFSDRVGLLAAFFRSILFISIINDLTVSPAYPAELVAVWFIYFLSKLINEDKTALVFLSFLVGMMFSIHVILFPFIIILILTFLVKKPFKLNPKLLLKSFIALIIPILPLIIFEIRHHFSHINRFLSALAEKDPAQGNDLLGKLFSVSNSSISNFYYLFDGWVIPRLLGYLICGAIIFALYKHKKYFDKSYHWFLFLIILIVYIFYYTLYPRHTSEYYFLGLTPLIILYSCSLLILLAKSIWGKLLFAIFISITLYSNSIKYVELHNNPYRTSLRQKDQAVKSIVEHQIGKGNFSVSYFMKYGREYGFQYFFTYYGLEPIHEIKPPIYSIVMPRGQVSENDLSQIFGNIGVIFPEKEPEQGK